MLSDGVFESKYCMIELASAVNAGVEVVLVTKEGSRWPNQNGDMVETFPPPELIDALEPSECRAAFTRRAITHTNEYYAAFSHNLMQAIEATIKEHRVQHGEPPNGQDNPDRLVLAQRRQLLIARAHRVLRSQAQRGAVMSASEPEQAVALLESCASTPAALVDLDRLQWAITVGESAGSDPRLLSMARRKLKRVQAHVERSLEDELAEARDGIGCEFQFLRAKALLECDDASMPRHQDVRERDGDSFKPLYLTAAECCQHLYRDKVLVVSHRWDRRDAPDPSGTQMKALKRHLRANPNYEYVWVVRAARSAPHAARRANWMHGTD